MSCMLNVFLIVCRFSALVRKIWNPRAFKGQVSPHELVQEISNASRKRFKLTEQSNAIDFLSWFLNTLHKDLGGTKKKNSSRFEKKGMNGGWLMKSNLSFRYHLSIFSRRGQGRIPRTRPAHRKGRTRQVQSKPSDHDHDVTLPLLGSGFTTRAFISRRTRERHRTTGASDDHFEQV